MSRLHIWVTFLSLLYMTNAHAQDRFEQAVVCIKQFEGLHSRQHHPYVGYGHKLLPGEHYPSPMSEQAADSLLRQDLLQKCSVFRRFGRDSLLLGVLAYNVGETALLGNRHRPRSQLILKLKRGNRKVYAEYTSFCRYKGNRLPALAKRREIEYQLLHIE